VFVLDPAFGIMEEQPRTISVHFHLPDAEVRNGPPLMYHEFKAGSIPNALKTGRRDPATAICSVPS
jgi:hypothetical protein